MKQILLLIALPCLLLTTTPSFARGHGGGHGGGHAHSSHSSNNHTSYSNNSFGHNQANNAKSKKTKTIITRSTSPSVIAAHHGHSLAANPANRTVNTNVNNAPAALTPRVGGATATPFYENYSNGYYGNGYYGNPYAYYGYNYSPIFYDPYYSPFTFCYGFMYSPSYYPVNSPNYANNTTDDQVSRQPMDGFVVFYNDTLSGAVTLAKRAVSMETTDSGKDYDYRFHEKDPGLQYVTVYNEDDKQLNLVRLKGDTKNLWRIIHIGKLNIYDRRRGFLYKPEDVDLKTLAVSLNGEITSLNSSSVKTAKEWLTKYVNQAYGLALDPKNFTWKELLVYVDKLD